MEGTFLWELQQFDLVRINLLKFVIIKQKNPPKPALFLLLFPQEESIPPKEIPTNGLLF